MLRRSGWQARLSLGFEARAARTVLAHRRHLGPLVVQKPFYPEGEVCHVYLLHPPGGVVGGDELQLEVDVSAGARALITTPAAAKFYRSAGPLAIQRQRLRVASGAALEWLPQETIFFDGCEVDTTTQVELEAGASFVGWEMLCLGRPAAAERFETGRCRQRFELWREGRPLLIERALLEGGSELLQAAWGLGAQPVTATMVAAPAGRQELDAVRAAVMSDGHALFSATLMDEVLVCRFLGAQAQGARRCFSAAWSAIRPALLGRSASAPRIWNT